MQGIALAWDGHALSPSRRMQGMGGKETPGGSNPREDLLQTLGWSIYSTKSYQVLPDKD